MQQENWFFTPVWYEYLTFDTDKVAQKCLQLREQNFANRTLSNVGGWQSTDIDLYAFDELKIVGDMINSRLRALAESVDDDLVLKLDNVWININEQGNANQRHVHPSSAFSGTIYIQVNDNTGKIKFFDEHLLLKHYPLKLKRNKMFHEVVTYTPKDGMLIFFPSWISHEVEPSQSEMTRISISFNIRQV